MNLSFRFTANTRKTELEIHFELKLLNFVSAMFNFHLNLNLHKLQREFPTLTLKYNNNVNKRSIFRLVCRLLIIVLLT